MNKPKLPNKVDQVLVSKHHILSKGGSWMFPESILALCSVTWDFVG